MARLFTRASSQLLHVAATPITAMPWTMSCWFYSSDLTVIQTLMCIGRAANNADNFQIRIAGTTAGDPITAIQGNPTNAATATSTTGCTVNTWHHAAGVGRTATDFSAYIDGGSRGNSTTNFTPTGLDTFSVGVAKLNNNFNFMSGRICEVGLWNIALTDDQVLALSKGVSPLRIRPDALQIYAPIYGVGSPEPNYGLANTTYNLTVTGATQVQHAPVQVPFGYDRGWHGAFTAAGGATAKFRRTRSKLGARIGSRQIAG